MVVGLVFFISIDVLILSEGGKIVFLDKLDKGQKIEISQIHSLSKTWVRDVFVFDENDLYHRLSVYEDEGGAGMPSAKSSQEELIYRTDGSFEIRKNDLMKLPMGFFISEKDAWILSTRNQNYGPQEKEIKLDIKSMSIGRYLLLKIRCRHEI